MAKEIIDNHNLTDNIPRSLQDSLIKNKTNRIKRRELLSEGSNKAYHRLCSILHDHDFVSKVLQMHRQQGIPWPVVVNQRCGSVRRLYANGFGPLFGVFCSRDGNGVKVVHLLIFYPFFCYNTSVNQSDLKVVRISI